MSAACQDEEEEEVDEMAEAEDLEDAEEAANRRMDMTSMTHVPYDYNMMVVMHLYITEAACKSLSAMETHTHVCQICIIPC